MTVNSNDDDEDETVLMSESSYSRTWWVGLTWECQIVSQRTRLPYRARAVYRYSMLVRVSLTRELEKQKLTRTYADRFLKTNCTEYEH